MQETNSRLLINPSRELVKSDENYDESYSFINALCMNAGDGENSYTSNSPHQRLATLRARPILVESTKQMLADLDFPSRIKFADLGCSSGQNTLLVMSEFMDCISVLCQEKGQSRPEIDYCLNDLFGNDFNTTFRSLDRFQKKLMSSRSEGACFVSGVPGSFYSRLFPTNTLHFVHSSYSLHFLSKVPKGLEDNKKSVYITTSSPLGVYKAYLDQFQKDFSLFLRLRSKEMVPKGRMVLTLIGRTSYSDPLFRDCCHFWTLLSQSLLHLVSEGVVSESEMESFKMPFYDPEEGEVRDIIKEEGSFVINKMETQEFGMYKSCSHYINHYEEEDDDVSRRANETGKRVAKCIRAVSEPMLGAHFGHHIIDRLFSKYADLASLHAFCGIETTVNLVVSMNKI